MGSLSDIGELSKEVNVRGVSLTVRPVTAEGLFYLISSFPDIKGIMEKAKVGADGKPENLKADSFMDLAGDAIGTIIAVSTVDRQRFKTFNDWAKQVRKDSLVGARLGVAEQLQCVNEILELSFSEEGAGPFVEQLMRFVKRMGVKGMPTSLENLTEVSATPSPEQLSGALQMGITPKRSMRGLIRLAS